MEIIDDSITTIWRTNISILRHYYLVNTYLSEKNVNRTFYQTPMTTIYYFSWLLQIRWFPDLGLRLIIIHFSGILHGIDHPFGGIPHWWSFPCYIQIANIPILLWRSQWFLWKMPSTNGWFEGTPILGNLHILQILKYHCHDLPSSSSSSSSSS